MVFATNKIAHGELNQKVEIDFRDEVGQLAQAFNQMTENLKTANEKLIQWVRRIAVFVRSFRLTVSFCQRRTGQ